MVDNAHDEFLDDATYLVADAWRALTGILLTLKEIEELNDVLTAFFGGRRPRPCTHATVNVLTKGLSCVYCGEDVTITLGPLFGRKEGTDA